VRTGYQVVVTTIERVLMHPLAPLALLACSMVTAASAFAATPATTQIVQQRLSDGRILLTDQPVRGATTERSWRLPAEDPVAARRRAAELSAESHLVSERIERLLERQRRADEERERTRLARLEIERQRERERAFYDDEVFVGTVVPLAAYPWLHRRGHSRFEHRPGQGGRPHPAPRPHGSARPSMFESR
jgi:hypothetical protein